MYPPAKTLKTASVETLDCALAQLLSRTTCKISCGYKSREAMIFLKVD